MPLRLVDIVGNKAFERELQNGWGIDISEFRKIINDAIAKHMADDDPPDDSEVAKNETPGSYYEWTCRTGPDDEDEDGEIEDEIDDDTITPARQDTITPARQPKSIFDDDLEFGRIFGASPKKAEVDKSNPFVFIANRLTFLIQTMHPIIFDTSIIETGNNSMTIAVNVDKTFPKLDGVDGLGFITGECNRSGALQNEISTYLEGTDFDRIYCFPTTIERDDVEILAVKFVIYPKRKNHNFGPAFLNHSK